MSLYKAKQIAKFQHAYVGITGFSAVGGTSDAVTAALTTALSTAGDGGVPVVLQVGSAAAQTEGVVVAPPYNAVSLYDGVTGLQLTDGNGHDVYGRITNSGSTWTLGYFTAPGGTETAYAMPAAQVLSFEFQYVFNFVHLPATAGVGAKSRHVAPDPAAYGWREQTDALTVTAANTLSNLSQTPDGRKLVLSVNGKPESSAAVPAPFTYSGKTLTWSVTNAGYALDTGDQVTATYTY